MRIKKLILPHRKHRDVLIQTGKEPDLSPLSSSQQLCVSSYSNADMLWRDVGNNLRPLQHGWCYQPLNTQTLCARTECIVEDRLENTAYFMSDTLSFGGGNHISP